MPNDTLSLRPLRIPNLEVARLYRAEIVERFLGVAGGRARLMLLHGALMEGNAPVVGDELAHIAENAASAFDLTSENSWHMLLLGLLFNMRGYADPISNREYGLGRPDIRLEPVKSPFAQGERPLITIELKRTGCRSKRAGALGRRRLAVNRRPRIRRGPTARTGKLSCSLGNCAFREARCCGVRERVTHVSCSCGCYFAVPRLMYAVIFACFISTFSCIRLASSVSRKERSSNGIGLVKQRVYP